MKQILIILSLFASVSTFAQSPRIKLNQITKDSVTGSVLISSPTDSGMVYSRDLFISYGADTFLILGGDTLAATSSIISSVLSDGVTITGDGTSGNELTVDTATVIATKQDLDLYYLDSNPDGYTSNTGTVTSVGGTGTVNGISLSGTVTSSGNLTLGGTLSNVNLASQVTGTLPIANGGTGSATQNFVDLTTTQTVGGAKTFTSDVNIDAKIALNDGDNNVVIGDGAGASLVSGQGLQNVLIGIDVGRLIDSSDNNLAIGYQALYSNTTGDYNVANGALALYSNTTGDYNVVNGYNALYSNTTANYNTANGAWSLHSNTTGNQNTANGAFSLFSNTTGDYNAANGAFSLYSNTTGDNNVVNGYQALFNLSSGSGNQAYGYEAGRYYGSGSSGLTTANGSFFFGTNSRASANGNSNEIVIGTDAIGNGSNSITLGASTNTKIVLNGVSSTGGTNSALYITSGGELTTNSSDKRLKTNIKSLDSELNTVLNLNPVTYNFTNNLGETTFGFIAQELAKYYPDLVFTNPISKYKGVHYHLFAPILTKAIQEQQAIIETQEQTITDLQRTIQSLITRIDNLENK